MNPTPTVAVPAGFVAYTSAIIGQAIGLEVSGSQIVGAGIGVIGFLMAGLITLSVNIVAKKLSSIERISAENAQSLSMQAADIKLIRNELDSISTWKKEREAAHQKNNEAYVQELRHEIDELQKLKGE